MPTVTVKKARVRGQVCWMVYRREHGKRKRTFFASKRQAEAEAAVLRGQAAAAGEVWLSLPAAERQGLMEAFAEAQRSGLDLAELVRSNRGTAAVTVVPGIGKVIEELLAAKGGSGRAAEYVKVLGYVLNGFAKGREALPLDRFGLREIEAFLNAHALAYRKTLRARLSMLFRFAVRRGYLAANPCDRLEPVRVQKAPPVILTVKQVEACLRWLKTHPAGFGWFVLSTFCGLRPEEAMQTRWENVNFAEGFIKVEAQTTKTRMRRIVYPRPWALKWLQRAKRAGGQLPLNKYEKRWLLTSLREELGLATWPKDVTRHTAASYWLALEGDAVKVSTMLGHSVATLNRDYKALVTRAEAERLEKV